MAENLIKLGGYVVQGHGSDETVLWEGNSGQIMSDTTYTCNLSESKNNFEKIMIRVQNSFGGCAMDFYYTFDSQNLGAISISGTSSNNTQWLTDICAMKATDNTIAFDGGCRMNYDFSKATWSRTANRGPIILKIVGINRKAQQ